MLDLGGLDATLDTVASISDLSAVVYLGHPEQPDPGLEEALLAGNQALICTAAAAVAPQWVWAGRPGAAGGAVVIDEVGLRDCADVLRTLGVSPRVVPARTPVDERIAIAGSSGSLVVEASRMPATFTHLPGSDRLSALAPIWYGLIQACDAWPKFTTPAQVWLAFGPSDDRQGSLRESLGVFADLGIDLQHVRSHPQEAGPHHFFTSFACPHVDAAEDLVAQLDARGVAHRTLAVLLGSDFQPRPAALAPQWAPPLAPALTTDTPASAGSTFGSAFGSAFGGRASDEARQ
jgi:hypothetical protein